MVLPLSHSFLTAEQRASIGCVAVESTHLERFVEAIIWHFLEVDEEKGKYVTHTMQMGTRLDVMRDLAKQVLEPEEIKILGELVAQMKVVNEKRNLVIHGEWAPADGYRLRNLFTGPSNAVPAVATKRRLRDSPQVMSASEVDAVAATLSSLYRALIRAVGKWKHLERRYVSGAPAGMAVPPAASEDPDALRQP